MITSSIVIYKSSKDELSVVLTSVIESIIEKVYLIDNSPTNELSYFANLSSKIEYIFGHGNIGYGAAHNIGLRKSIAIKAQYHIVINPDIQFEKSVITDLYSVMNNNSNIGLIMPKVIYPNGDLQYLCKLIPSPVDLIFKRFFPKSFVDKRMSRFQLKFTSYDKEMNVPYLSGCFMFLRIETLKEIGLFDERYFMYPEDIDLSRRIHEKYITLFYPNVQIIHAHAAESYQNKKMLWIHITNMIKYFNKWGWFFDKKRKKINRLVLDKLKNK